MFGWGLEDMKKGQTRLYTSSTHIQDNFSRDLHFAFPVTHPPDCTLSLSLIQSNTNPSAHTEPQGNLIIDLKHNYEGV